MPPLGQPALAVSLDTLDDHGSLAVQLIGVALMTLLLAVLQSTAFVIFQHAMLPAELALAEGAIADDALCLIFAVLEGTSDLLWSAATYRKSDVDRGVRRQRG